MYDMGVYCLNVVCYVIGEELIVVLVQEVNECLEFMEVDENILFQLEFFSGVLVNCVISFVM